jgi:hypothetical protein
LPHHTGQFDLVVDNSVAVAPTCLRQYGRYNFAVSDGTEDGSEEPQELQKEEDAPDSHDITRTMSIDSVAYLSELATFVGTTNLANELRVIQDSANCRTIPLNSSQAGRQVTRPGVP